MEWALQRQKKMELGESEEKSAFERGGTICPTSMYILKAFFEKQVL